MNFYLLMTSFIVLGVLTGYCAQRRGRDPVIWFFIGVLFGIFGLIALFLMPATAPENAVIPVKDAPLEFPKEEPKIENLGKEWFILDQEHKQQGPMSFQFLKAKWGESSINPTTFVWSDGMTEWKRIRDLPDFMEKISE